MKHAVMFLLFASSTMQAAIPTDCLISVAPHWQNIESSCKYEDAFCSKWMLIGSVTLRKKANQKMKLETLRLTWHGAPIDHLDGSLYRKTPGKKFLPIDQNVVTDSNWNKARQELIFNFYDNKQSLGPLNIFYIVVSVPDTVESQLKKGHFSVVKQALPQSFQRNAQNLKIDLAHAIRLQDHTMSAIA